MDIIDMYYNVGQHKTKVLRTSSTVNQILFACQNFSRNVFGIILFRLFSNTSKSRKLIATKRVFFGQSLNKIVVNNCWFTVLQYVHDSLTRDILQR